MAEQHENRHHASGMEPQQGEDSGAPAQEDRSEAGRSGAASRGFASMEGDRQKQIASKGGTAVSRNREYMAMIGRKGGERVSQNREHMASIGRRGGERVSQNREHMASIGRRGGERVSQDREHMANIGRKGGQA
jgi:general stress protein YciG